MRLDSSPEFPRQFGAYLLLASFGRGGMGEVFLAQRAAIKGAERLCVIKTLRGELADDIEYIGRFLDEARVVTQLNHSAVSHVFDAGQVGSTYFMAMEYIPGITVRELERDIRKSGVRLSRGLVLYIVSQVLDALDYAHTLVHPLTGEDLKVVHRDVSPQNVMVSFQGDVKLIDFGLAQSSLKEENTSSEVVLGKVAYMSPEQARGEEVDGRCDQFAVGVMLFELLTDQRFYGSATTRDIWLKAGQGGHLPDGLEELDAPLAAIVSRAVERRADDRWPTCGSMRDAIDEVRTAYYPGVGRKQLGALIQEAFKEHIHNERAQLSRLGEISASGKRAPVTMGPLPFANIKGAQQATISQSRSTSASESSTSMPEAGVVGGAEGSSTMSREAARAVRGPRYGMWATVLVGLFVLTVVAVVLGGRALTGEPGVDPDAPPVATATPDAGATVIATAPLARDAGAPDAAEGVAVDGQPVTKRPTKKPRGKPVAKKPRIKPRDGVSEKPKEKPPTRAPVSEPVTTKPPPKKAASFADDLVTVKKCQRKCAKRLKRLIAGKSAAQLKKSEVLIRNCAKGCRGE